MSISISISGNVWSFASLNAELLFLFFPNYFPKHCSDSSSCDTSEGHPRGEMKVSDWLQRGHGKSQRSFQISSLLRWSWDLHHAFPARKMPPMQRADYLKRWQLLRAELEDEVPLWDSFQPSHGKGDRALFLGQRGQGCHLLFSEMPHRTLCTHLKL